MIFPATDTSNEVHALRIESFNQDPRCVFVEDVATFPTAIPVWVSAFRASQSAVSTRPPACSTRPCPRAY